MPDQTTELEQLLTTLLYDRGNVVYEWPDDEAEAYRELGWSEGVAAARKIMFEKAAKALTDAGFVKAPESVDSEAQIRRIAEELAYDRWPDQTVQDDPEVIDVCEPLARRILAVMNPTTEGVTA